LLVVLPPGSGEVATNDALDGKHFGSLDEHAAAFELVEERFEFCSEVCCVGGDQVVWDDRFKEIKPEQRQPSEDLSFERNATAKDMIERRDAVASDEEELVGGEGVDVADLTACGERERSEMGF